MTTKIHMVCDTLGRPLRFILTAGQRQDCLSAKTLLDGFKCEAVLADKAYDNNDLRQTIAEMQAEAVNPIEMAYSKLKALLRKAAERSTEALWNRIGQLLDAFTAQECANFFKAAGYGAA